MNIGTNNSYSSIYGQYSSLFSASSSNTAYSLAKRSEQSGLVPTIDKDSTKKNLLDNTALKYVKDIKTGAAELNSALNSLGRGSTYASAKPGATAKPDETSESGASTQPAEKDSAAVTQLQKFADGYNKLYGAAVNNSDDPRSEKLFNQLVNTSKTYTGSLAKAGVEFDENGYMTVNKDKAKAAEKDGSLQNLFSGASRSYGFSSRMSKTANDVQRKTQRFVTPANVGKSLMDAVSYNSSGSVGGVNNTGAGWLINMMF
jgi:hypothetical protein